MHAEQDDRIELVEAERASNLLRCVASTLLQIDGRLPLYLATSRRIDQQGSPARFLGAHLAVVGDVLALMFANRSHHRERPFPNLSKH